MMKIIPTQVEKVHRLVRELCANCDEDGNCILLDDGEAHRCVQLISIYGIYCNYFKEAVLPSDRELYEQIKKINKLKVLMTAKSFIVVLSTRKTEVPAPFTSSVIPFSRN